MLLGHSESRWPNVAAFLGFWRPDAGLLQRPRLSCSPYLPPPGGEVILPRFSAVVVGLSPPLSYPPFPPELYGTLTVREEGSHVGNRKPGLCSLESTQAGTCCRCTGVLTAGGLWGLYRGTRCRSQHHPLQHRCREGRGPGSPKTLLTPPPPLVCRTSCVGLHCLELFCLEA